MPKPTVPHSVKGLVGLAVFMKSGAGFFGCRYRQTVEIYWSGLIARRVEDPVDLDFLYGPNTLDFRLGGSLIRRYMRGQSRRLPFLYRDEQRVLALLKRKKTGRGEGENGPEKNEKLFNKDRP